MPRVLLLTLGSWLLAQSAAAQGLDPRLDARVAFYGDNTEFSNPFREGETLLGAFTELFVEATLSERLTLRGGLFVNQRFEDATDMTQVRPVLALVIGGARSRLVLGTLETVRRIDGRSGPDRIGPHDLPPPVQRETLAFERPWEAGVQWIVDTTRVRQDAWLHWQRVTTPERRERFDAGQTMRVRLRRALALRTDVHVVHQGGQLSAVGPVSDSYAFGAGVIAGGPVGRLDRVALEGLAMLSRDVPDRERTASARTGFGTFVRGSVEEGGWRAHAILWRGEDFIKREGDPLYGSLRRDGTRFRGVRDYAEAGLTRTFPLARASYLEVSGRFHRIERDYEYSFRIFAVARLRMRLTKQP